MEGSSECEFLSAQSVAATVSTMASSSSQYESAEDESMTESGSLSTSTVEERIEASKWHWSELSDSDRSLSGEEEAAENREEFKTLQSHPEWGRLFWTFNEGSRGTLVVGEKVAEGGQAELYNAHVNWTNPLMASNMKFMKFALKVFKKGALLRDLQGQWPHGYLKWERDKYRRGNSQQLSTPSYLYYNSPICGTLLEDGRFAFLMQLYEDDLQTFIKWRMHGSEDFGCGPFSEEESDVIMYRIALGVLWLHEHDVVHRDLKAANVLVDHKSRHCDVADYECSIGVVGTGYWRAPREILQACKDKTVSQKEELFTKASDVYSYAITCYEILTGKGPFEGEMVTMELVIGGQRPTVPTIRSDWAQQLLYRCWDTNCSARPSIQEILTIIASNTNMKWIKDMDVIQRRSKVTDVEELQLGCGNPLHTFTRLENGILKCVLCFERRNESMIKCTTCTDHYLHSSCAIIENVQYSFIHRYVLVTNFLNIMGDIRRRCDGCQLEIEREYWYRCLFEECDFHLHLQCAKYVEKISHPLHEKHKLVLSSSSSSTSLKDSNFTCECCKVQFNPMEFVYHCEECAFHIHPKCAAQNLQVHRIIDVH